MTLTTFIIGFILASALYDIIKLGIKMGYTYYLIKKYSPEITYQYSSKSTEERQKLN